MRLRDRRVQMTYPVRLTCQIIGYPHPEIIWHKDNEPITFGGTKTRALIQKKIN
jgi:Immunoglobulin I-set domain